MSVVGAFRALAYRFTLETEDFALERHLGELLAELQVPDPDQEGIGERLVMRGPEDPSLEVNGELVAGSTSAERLLPSLIGHLNRRAVTSVADRLFVVHAGSVAMGSSAVLLPAPAESGKTTLTAGLVERGFDYVTDEALGVDPDSLALLPYPKPLSIDPGSWTVLDAVRPDVDERLRPLHALQWQVAPRHSVSGEVRASAIVFPSYREGSTSRLEPIGRADAVLRLAQNSFNFHERGRLLLPVLADLASSCDCYVLTVGGLSEACDQVVALAGGFVAVPA